MTPYTLHQGDCRDVMAGMDANSVDAIVCDPPYGLHFMGKTWDKFGGPTGKDNRKHSLRGGAMHAGKYDLSLRGMTGFQEQMYSFAAAALHPAKPGAHLLAFGGTRTFHRLTVAIEDAGWEIRDTIMWVYGSGFPKSLDVSKAIDAAAGAERGRYERPAFGAAFSDDDGTTYGTAIDGIPITDLARQWQGWGTALKPAWEPVIVARKPLAGTVAANVAQFGTGGINIDACRIETADALGGGAYSGDERQRSNYSASDIEASATLTRLNRGIGEFVQPLGRWPANLIHDGSDEVTALFPESEDGVAGRRSDGVGMFNMGGHAEWGGYGQSGSAARFFYTAKASREDREEGLESLPLRSAGEATDRVDGSAGLNSPRAGASRTNGARNHHPTVKPTSLMRYLCRLVTPREGIVLDPFMGSGSTGKAAILEGFRFIGIDLEPEYVEIARARCEWAMAQPRQLVLEDAS